MKQLDLYEGLAEKGEWLYHNWLYRPKKAEIQEELPSFYPADRANVCYPQNWPIYYKACRTEKIMFYRILKDAVDYLEIPIQYAGNGRPAAFYADIVKAICIMEYNRLSTWRLESDLRLAKSMGVIDHVYKKSCISKYMNLSKVVEILQELYKIIAEPIIPIETQYAVDATGIANDYKAKKWVEVRLEKQEHRVYSKLHIMCGTLTNVIVASTLTDGMQHESPILAELLKQAKRFSIKELSADPGYLSRKNCQLIAEAGAVPYIKPKKNTISSRNLGTGTAWGTMIRLWKNHQLLFAAHYHRRSNVESTFSMAKRKWGDYCKCKLPMAQTSEVLAKIVCHNCSVLSEAMLNNDLEPKFMDS